MATTKFMSPDKAQFQDTVLVNGLISESLPHRHDIIGEVEVLMTSKATGEVLFTKTLRNDLLISGRTFFLEKVMNVRADFNPPPVDVTLGVHAIENIDRTSATIPQEIVCGLIIGTGGTTNTYNTVKPVKPQAICVPDVIPYRVVPTGSDLIASDRSKYFLRVVQGGYAYYYGKFFELAGSTNVMYEDGTAVPNTVYTEATTKTFKTYNEYKVTVDNRDVREYFKMNDGSTANSRVNSVGLVVGYPVTSSDGYTEYSNVRCITTLNMENQELKDSESTITFIYRLLIR